jgi:hypothetical protein
MSNLRAKLKHAFAVESETDFEPTEKQREVVDRLAKEVARRRMTTPALLFLEMSRPLNFIASQIMHYFQPIISAVLDTGGYQAFAEFLEHRGSVQYLCRRIEHFERNYEAAEAEPKTPLPPEA